MNLRPRWQALRGSLTFRAVAGMGVAMLVIILTGSAILHAVYSRAINAHFQREGESKARALARAAQLGVFAENPAELRPLFAATLENEDIIAAYTYKLDGELIFSLGGGPEKDEAAAELPAGSVPVLSNQGGHELSVAGDRHVDFWAVVSADTEPLAEEVFYFEEQLPPRRERPIGLVCLRISTAPMGRWLAFMGQIGLAAGALFLVVSVFTSFLVIRAMHRPLSALLAHLRQSGRAGEQGREVDILSSTYHDLLRQLNDSFRTIEQMNVELEEKVRERTGELTASNRDLAGALAELRETQSQLIQSEKMAAMGQLVAGLAHEINNATHIVLQSLANLRRRIEPGIADRQLREQAATLLTMMEEGGRRTARIVEDLLTFARPAQSRYQWAMLNQGLRSTISLLAHHFSPPERQLVLDLDERQPGLPCKGDQLNQVFLNLILNAVQAIGDRGTIRVASRHDERNIYVEVSDSGPGVAPAVRPHIFNPFFTTKRPGQGTGLGLAVSYRIVAEHGGAIELVDAPEWGALFRVTLPRNINPTLREQQP